MEATTRQGNFLSELSLSGIWNVLDGGYRNMTQELLYPTALRLRGPWLLETKQLLVLDEILEQFRSRDPRASDHISESKKSLTIFLSRERELKTSSFKEAMSHIASQNEVAKGFEYFVKMQNTATSVRLLPRKRGDQKKQDEEERFLEINVSPQSDVSSHEIFGELRNWADTVEAPLWQQWLLFYSRPLYRFGLAFVLIILLAMLLNTAPTAAEYKDALKQQGRTLLRDGINQQNQTKALELVLALESDYIPPGTKPQQARKPIAWYLIAAYTLGFLSFTPTLCIAIWAGKRHLRWWNAWTKINTITIPGLVLAHWVYPQLFSALEAALRH